MSNSVWAGRAILIAFAGWLIFPPIIMTDREAKTSAVPTPRSSERQQSLTTTRAVEQIRVGQRVLAENPEVDDADRISRPDPDWAEWVHLSMQLPLPGAGSGTVDVELLRPESWLRDHLGLVLSAPPLGGGFAGVRRGIRDSPSRQSRIPRLTLQYAPHVIIRSSIAFRLYGFHRLRVKQRLRIFQPISQCYESHRCWALTLLIDRSRKLQSAQSVSSND